MPSRRWDPGIGVGVCLATIWQDHITDSGNQDFYLVTLGRDLGIDKDYRKFEETLDWIESRIYTGYLTDSVILITFFMEIDPQYYQFGFFGVWLSRFCWDLKLARINLWRYGFMGEYFLTEFMENSNKYNRIVYESDEQEMNALFTNLPKIWKSEEKVTGTDLGFGKFQFDFKTEEDLEGVLKHQPYHFDFWMLSLAKWQPRQSRSFLRRSCSIKVIGIRLSSGRSLLLRVLEARWDGCVLKPPWILKEESSMMVRKRRYHCDMRNFWFRKLCGSLCHKDELCPLNLKNLKVSPERKRGNREGAGVWSDGKHHDDGAQSYKGVVINGNMGPPNKERDSREYYGKGKGKMYEESDSKWVKVAERGSRRPPNHYGNYRGDRESSSYNNARRGDGRRGGTGGEGGAYTVHTKVSSWQARGATPRSLPRKLEKKERLRATEGIMEVTDVEKGLLEVQGMVEKQDALTDDVMKDIDMEMDAINANLLKNGMDMEAEDEFQTLSEEEAEQALGDQIVHTHAQEEEELGNGDGALNDDTGAGDMGTRQSSERLFKPPIRLLGVIR
ncbi:hypothetical protein Bca52824_037272 [Brassica carinata]|uniref:DUF4283 domain-containing protein n=1 Tax=Brassica carinata TaxID=52824 RepID=A0A8X7S6F1_BRACI|nr:hypothetical protein Bca52824_037272 [Brassica carinata]